MMMNMPGASHAIELAKENPKLQVGIHLVLTCGKPILTDVPSLVDENGNFKKLSEINEGKEVSLDDLEREWTAQMELLLENGIQPTHFDSHHHVHTFPALLPVVQKIASKYNLSARRFFNEPMNDVRPYTDVFLADFYGDSATYDYFEEIRNRVQDGQTVEVMCHPGYLDKAILGGSSYALDRVKETEILTTISLPEGMVLL
jgi:predicted glycoside hydrolase/deacetylase ChbG (UPF0249 family)